EAVTMKERISPNVIIVLFFTLCFQDVLQNKFSILKFADELMAVSLSVLLMVKNLKYKKINKESVIIIIMCIFITIIGLFGNILFEYQNIRYYLQDILAVFKAIIVYIALSNLLYVDENEWYIYRLNNLIQIISVILFTLSIINTFIPIFPHLDYRYGIKSQQLFFSHPTYLASNTILFIIILNSLRDKFRKNNIFIYMLSYVVIMTMRTKALVFLALYAISSYMLNKNRKIKIYHVIIIMILSIVVSYNKINEQFVVNDDYARTVLLSTSVDVAKDHFPWGSGFGTYASSVSAKNYSSIYEKYGIDNTYGLKKGQAHFVSDSFWPMILGQFGFIGMILYASILILIVKKLNKNKFKNKKYYYSGILVMTYLIITSTSESSFVNQYAISYMMTLVTYRNMLLYSNRS
ncbi:hypothetical protein, partial [Romboutsia sp.]|uniref:hypothetical protein n=1 Tax=Romboutsia sp. TaxID=1965302 RepID=UPI003F3079C3